MQHKAYVLTFLKFGQQFLKFQTEVGSLQNYIPKSLLTASNSDFWKSKTLSKNIMIDLISELDHFKNCFE